MPAARWNRASTETRETDPSSGRRSDLSPPLRTVSVYKGTPNPPVKPSEGSDPPTVFILASGGFVMALGGLRGRVGTPWTGHGTSPKDRSVRTPPAPCGRRRAVGPRPSPDGAGPTVRRAPRVGA